MTITATAMSPHEAKGRLYAPEQAFLTAAQPFWQDLQVFAAPMLPAGRQPADVARCLTEHLVRYAEMAQFVIDRHLGLDSPEGKLMRTRLGELLKTCDQIDTGLEVYSAGHSDLDIDCDTEFFNQDWHLLAYRLLEDPRFGDDNEGPTY